jgi:hypothetical protein
VRLNRRFSGRRTLANGTNRGYVDDLYAAEEAKIPNLLLTRFGTGYAVEAVNVQIH